MKDTVPIDSASVKVMRSYDYCHFEVCLSTTLNGLENGPAAVDELRKTAARLADKAVEQYKVAKANAEWRSNINFSKEELAAGVARILKDVPESERTPEQKAKIKKLSDEAYWARRYDYEDDWQDED